MKSKYFGKCASCGNEWNIGDEVHLQKVNGKWVGCTDISCFEAQTGVQKTIDAAIHQAERTVKPTNIDDDLVFAVKVMERFINTMKDNGCVFPDGCSAVFNTALMHRWRK